SFFFFSSRRRHTRFSRDWSSDVCSSDLIVLDQSRFGDLAVKVGQLIGALAREHATGGIAEAALVQHDGAELQQSDIAACVQDARSEERRVGKEGRSRWAPDTEKKESGA